MDRRAELNRSSSKKLSAFDVSFSVSEYGGLGLGDDEDFEAMAQLAEAEAQEKILRARVKDATIDSLLEGDDPDAVLLRRESSEGSDRMPKNKSKRWEPPKIPSDNEEEGHDEPEKNGLTRQQSNAQTLVISNLEEEPVSRNNSGHSDPAKQEELNRSEFSIHSTGSATAPNNVIAVKDMVASAPSAPNGGIHLNAPNVTNVTIIYNVEQKVESSNKAPLSDTSTMPQRDVSDISSAGGDSLTCSWPKDSNIIQKDHLVDSAKGEGDVSVRRKEAAPANVQPTIHENKVPEFVTPMVPPASVRTEPVMTDKQLNHLPGPRANIPTDQPSLAESELTATSRKAGGLTASTSSMSASMPSLYATKGMNATMPSKNPAVEQSDSVLKTTKKNATPPSEPFDLSELLDSLWSPSNPPNVPSSKSAPVMAARKPSDSSSSSSEDSGVYTTGGVRSYYSGETFVTGQKGGVANQNGRGRVMTQHTTGDRTGQRDDVATSHSRSKSRGRRNGADETSGASKVSAPQEINNSEQSAPETIGMNEGKDQSRSTSRGKAGSETKANRIPQPEEEELNHNADGTKNQSQSTCESGESSCNQQAQEGGPPTPSMRDLLATLPQTSDRCLSVYEDSSVDKDFDPSHLKRTAIPAMGRIAENDDSVTSSITEHYDIRSGISDLAQAFVDHFSKIENKEKQEPSGEIKQKRADGSDRSAIEERQAGLAVSRRPGIRRSSTDGKLEKGTMQGKHETRVRRAQSMGTGRLNQSLVTPNRSHTMRQERMSKSMKIKPQSNLLSEDEYKEKKKAPPRGARSKSRGRRRSDDRGDKNSGGKHNSSQKKKYSIGDTLQSEKDIIRDTNVNKILELDAFDHCMVKRSGGRWTYSIVSDVNKNDMTFVLDFEGKKKKIPRRDLLHNVRRLNYAECPWL